ncbi:MAG TPA: hypothetical protein VHR66_18870 [Gemmataceae bacterium]|jgi:hypothetical protein|nr:hypothetical protein [Gemmataceae bacterium]
MDDTPEPDPPESPPKGRKRSTDKELIERTEIVRRKLLTGETRKAVRLMITEEWGLKPTQSYWYLKQAEKEIQEAAARSRDEWLAEHIAIRRDIRRRANDQSDPRTELAAAESEAKLLGLEVNPKDRPPLEAIFALIPAPLAGELRKLLADPLQPGADRGSDPG